MKRMLATLSPLLLLLIVAVTSQAQTTSQGAIAIKRLKVYLKIEASSVQSRDKLTSSLRKHLRPHRKHFLFVFPQAQVENNPDIIFTIKERPHGYMELLAGERKSGIHYHSYESLISEILITSAVKARSLQVGKDQALEEFREALQIESEKKKQDRINNKRKP